ncbi:MAG: hypothetical protein GEV07_22030 [Streptosporangiales bacterium]|nr:hypothetical protein [Streptosporangiales bacterium]
MSRRRGQLVAGAVVLWLLAPGLLAAARWPSWWAWIAPEQTPMTWLQSVVLVLAAAGALLLAAIGAPAPRIWLLLAVGLCGLAFDERFAVHERIRDGFLAPRDVRVPFLPWVGPGDFLLLGVALVGLGVLPFVWRALAGDRLARVAFAVGVGLALVAVASDSVDPARWSVAAERWEQSLEEVVELGSGLALLCAVWLRLLAVLGDRLRDGRS